MLYQVENRKSPFTAGYASGLIDLPHIHPHLEMIYMQEGSSIATVDDKNFFMEKGDLFLSFPNQIHHYHALSAVKCHLIIFAPDLFKDLKKRFETQIPVSPIIKGSQLGADTNDVLNKIWEKNNSDSSFDRIAAKGYLLAFLGEILPLMTLVNTPVDHDSMKLLLTYCSENYTEPITLDSLSSELHLNKYYVSHIFKERMHIGFTDFVNNLRVEHACNLLEEGANITEIAFSSGFSSVRTFNRVFLQKMNMTPRDYIKAKEASL
ncbi:MAG: helix-turn-helix transcriptional regulator [Roseburia sp.]|nr:helix-turn-helix transcriptional regulator [Roseburia sp.]